MENKGTGNKNKTKGNYTKKENHNQPTQKIERNHNKPPQQHQARPQITKPLTKESESHGATPTTLNLGVNPQISIRYWIGHKIRF